MGVADDFQQFRNSYVLQQTTMDSISLRYKRITRQLNRDFWDTESETAHSLYIGSYGRDSAARGVSDIDIHFRLPYSTYVKYKAYQTNGPSGLLQAVKTSMGSTYSTTSLKGDGQIVQVSFSDGITFEVLPGFDNDDDSITFPDSNGGGSWRVCNPRAEMKAFATRNLDANHNLKAICRMARIWKNQHSVPMSGMLIDTLAYQFIATWPYRDKSYLYHDYLVRDYFLHLSQVDRKQQYWLAPGSGSYVWRDGGFETRASEAYNAALDAIRQTSEGYSYAARGSWQKIFGATYNA